jgi:streptogramin lyase
MGNCFQRLLRRTPSREVILPKPIFNERSEEAREEAPGLSHTPRSAGLALDSPNIHSNLFTVQTWAGDGTIESRDGQGKSCSINWPYEIKFDSSGNGIFTAYGSASVRKITPAGTVTTISDRLSDSGESFHCVRGLSIDKLGNIYIADTGNNSIRKINSETGFSENIKTDIELSNPYGITVGNDGTIYISDSYADRIMAINPEGHCEVIAGNVNGFSDGVGKEAKFSLPQGIQLDGEGNLIVADSKNNAIRKIDKQFNVTTVATGFLSPYGVAIDKKGNIFVADYGNNAIKVIDKKGKVRPVVGDYNSSYKETPNNLSMPTGMDIDPFGNLVICDCYHHILRKVNCVFVQMSDIWPRSHKNLPKPVSEATEEFFMVMTKSPPVVVPRELLFLMVQTIIEIWPF